MRFKNGVVIYKLPPEIERAMAIADDVFRTHSGREATITSVREGSHSENSKHYYRAGRDAAAFDLRVWRSDSNPILLPLDTRKAIEAAMRRRLTEEVPGRWYVLLEATHLHVQWEAANGVDTA